MTDKARWVVVAIAILTGAVLVGIGVVEGSAWVSMVGTILAGGGAAARPMK